MNILKVSYTSKAHFFTSQIVSKCDSPVQSLKNIQNSSHWCTQGGTSNYFCFVKIGIYLWTSTKIKRSLSKYFFGWFFWCHPYQYLYQLNRNTTIRVRAGTKRNSTKSTVNPNTTIHKHYHHGGAVRPSFGVGSMDPPDRTRRPSSKGVRRGGGVSG